MAARGGVPCSVAPLTQSSSRALGPGQGTLAEPTPLPFMPFNDKLAFSTSALRGDTMPFRITPPKQLTLLLSGVLAIPALVFRFSGLEIPAAINHPFGTLLLAYLVLLAGNLVEGA